MKIAVTGKGGVGKTTFAATLARLYAQEGKHVLAADVDPDANLGLALGFSEEDLDSIVPITRMRKLIQERKDRLIYASLVIIAANSGGAFSPIGDVTTIMLWNKGLITAAGVIKELIVPSLVSVALPAPL